jgi:hypothetical protein
MSFKLPRHPEAFAGGMKAEPEKAPDYESWVRTLSCVVSGRRPVETAHLSTANLAYGHTGRGKSQKASSRWVLPLSPDLHADQHRGSETAFWDKHGVNPYLIALALYGAYSETARDEIAAHILSKAWRF